LGALAVEASKPKEGDQNTGGADQPEQAFDQGLAREVRGDSVRRSRGSGREIP
jgi:hypothetical protein